MNSDWGEGKDSGQIGLLENHEDRIDMIEAKPVVEVTPDVYSKRESVVLHEFLCRCRSLNTDEFVFLMLKLLGFTYGQIQEILPDLVKSDSSVHRRVFSAQMKLQSQLNVAFAGWERKSNGER